LIDLTLKVAGLFLSFSIMLKEIYLGFGVEGRPSLKYSKLCATDSTRLGLIKKPLPLTGTEFDGLKMIHPMQLWGCWWILGEITSTFRPIP
jgi:hypothetical protein